MKYEEFRKSIKEAERLALDLVFKYGNDIDNELFFACYSLAEELSTLKEENLIQFINSIKTIPYSTCASSLLIANIINSKNSNLYKNIRKELKLIYLKDYKEAICKKKLKFAMFNDECMQDYISLKARLVDGMEIIALAKQLNINTKEVIGEYKGENKDAQILSRARARINKQFNFEELRSEISIKAINNFLNKENKINHC